MENVSVGGDRNGTLGGSMSIERRGGRGRIIVSERHSARGGEGDKILCVRRKIFFLFTLASKIKTGYLFIFYFFNFLLIKTPTITGIFIPALYLRPPLNLHNDGFNLS